MERINIFIDTNILKEISPNLLEFTFSETYKKLKEFIKENEYNKIHIVIPTIVIEELIQQYIEDYNEMYENLGSQIDELIDKSDKIGWKIKLTKKNNMNLEKYKIYIKNKAKKYVEQEKINIADISEKSFKNIVKRAIEKELPFFCGKGRIDINGSKESSKEFSDAGFKDVIFLESIIKYDKLKRGKVIIVTKDKIVKALDWKRELNENKVKVFDIDQGEQLIKCICNEEKIKDLSEYRKFCKDEYYKNAIFDAINMKVLKVKEIIENNEEEKIAYYDIKTIVKNGNQNEQIKVRISEEKEFVEIFNKEGKVIYEW